MRVYYLAQHARSKALEIPSKNLESSSSSFEKDSSIIILASQDPKL